MKKHSRAKVDPSDVILIRRLIEEKRAIEAKLANLTYDKIGEKFDLSGHAVKQIASGRSWSTLFER